MMRRYYVVDHQYEADELERLIRDRGFALAQQAGRYVSRYGLSSERMANDGTLVEDRAVRTKAWDVPTMRADGRWIVLHPDAHPAAGNPQFLAFVTDGISAEIEEASPDWWPDPDAEEILS